MCLYGDDDVPEELSRNTTVISRQAPDEDLRAALLGAPPAPAEMAEDVDTGPAVIVPSGAPGSFEPVEPAPTPATPGLREIKEPSTPSPRTPRVLLVEDNPVNLMVGQRLLAMLGITCDTAGNGEAALMRMSASRYDLVLMDCQMPVMDGYTATRQWRKSEAEAGGTRHLPIIAMTANAMAGDRQKCLDAGMDDYLPKPVTRSELERCIYHWWNPDQPQRDEPAPAAESEGEAADAAMVEAEDAAQTAEAEAVALSSPSKAPAPAAMETTAGAPAAAPVVEAPAAPERREPHVPALPESQLQIPDPKPDPVETEAAIPSEPAPAAPATRQPPPVIDEEVLEELRSMLGDEVQHLVEVFLEDTPKLLARLEVAASEGDMDGLRDAAHSLKSSSANLGAMLLSAAARRVEQGAREGTLERPAVAVALVVNEFARARRQLRASIQAQA